MVKRTLALPFLLLTLAACDPASPPPAPEGAERAPGEQAEATTADPGFESFISPDRLDELQQQHGENLVLVDARDPEEYAKGHLPGAVNLPGRDLRTPPVGAGQGESQYIFRTPGSQGTPGSPGSQGAAGNVGSSGGSVDIERYEKLLGEAGLTRDLVVVVYGNHAGQRDGSIPAMILDWLGQEKVYFLDGVGYDEWVAAGRPSETAAVTRPAAEYVAAPAAEPFVWNLEDVQAHLTTDDVLFYDTRSIDEYTGADLRDNARGGHIPGAVWADYALFLDENKRLKPRPEIERIIEKQGLPEAKAAGKPIVMYCQTSTRVSLPYLLLHDMGYDNVAIYDASWHEYGNRDDTEIATDAPSIK